MSTLQNSEHWVAVLAILHRRLRKLVLVGAILCAFVFVEVFFHQSRLAEEELAFRVAIAELRLKPEFLDESRRYVTACHCGRVGVPISHLPTFAQAVNDKVKAGIRDRSYRIGPVEMPVTPYHLILLVAPIAILLAQLTTIAQVRRIHAMLAGQAQNDEPLQQTLNSPFFERVTRAYGERRISHAIAIAVINLPSVLSALLTLPAILALSLAEPRVTLNLDGTMKGPDPGVLIEGARYDVMIFWWYALIVIVVSLWLIVSTLGSRTVGAPLEEGCDV